LVDLTDILPEERVLRVVREAEFRRVLDLDALDAAVERARGRRFLVLVREAGIPRPEANVKVRRLARSGSGRSASPGSASCGNPTRWSPT
jgi:hypothetical protein